METRLKGDAQCNVYVMITGCNVRESTQRTNESYHDQSKEFGKGRKKFGEIKMRPIN